MFLVSSLSTANMAFPGTQLEANPELRGLVSRATNLCR